MTDRPSIAAGDMSVGLQMALVDLILSEGADSPMEATGEALYVDLDLSKLPPEYKAEWDQLKANHEAAERVLDPDYQLPEE